MKVKMMFYWIVALVMWGVSSSFFSSSVYAVERPSMEIQAISLADLENCVRSTIKNSEKSARSSEDHGFSKQKPTAQERAARYQNRIFDFAETPAAMLNYVHMNEHSVFLRIRF